MRNKILLLCFIFGIAFFLRFYKLGEIPNGLQRDETSLGYNAYSILLTGKDEHGVFLPQNFKAFGEYKLPGYIYLLVPFIKLFGLTPFSVRLPSALCGSLTVLLLYFLVKELFHKTENSINELKNGKAKEFSLPRYLQSDESLPILSSFLLAINPWHIHFSRGAFEVTISLFFLTTGFYLFYRGIRRHSVFGIFAIIFLALATYTYNISRLFIPLLFAYSLYSYKNTLHLFSKKTLLLGSIVCILSFTPLIVGLIEKGGISSTKGTILFTSAPIQAPILEFRSYLTSLPSFFVKPFFNSFIQSCWVYINNIFSYASVQFFFISGSSHGNHGIGNVGQWYIWEFVPIILGFLFLIRQKSQKYASLLLVWIGTTIAIASLTREVPQATRSFNLIIPITICSALGIRQILGKSQSFTNKSKFLLILCFFGIIYNFIFYITSYYVHFPIAYAKAWNEEDKNLSLFIGEHEKEFNSILIDKNIGFTYTSLLFYTKFNPNDFQGAEWSSDDSEGFSYPIRFGKYEYKTIDWKSDMKRPNTLIITKSDMIEKGISPRETFSYPTRPVVIAVGQDILQYPVSENAYAIVKTER